MDSRNYVTDYLLGSAIDPQTTLGLENKNRMLTYRSSGKLETIKFTDFDFIRILMQNNFVVWAANYRLDGKTT